MATALVASVADPKAFRSGRNFAAWIGLVPKQNSVQDDNLLAQHLPDSSTTGEHGRSRDAQRLWQRTRNVLDSVLRYCVTFRV